MSLDNMMSKLIGEAMADAETISKSAVSMAIDRTKDLKGNPVITLVMMEALCKVAVEDYIEKAPPMPGTMQMEEGLTILRDLINKGIHRQWDEHKAKMQRIRERSE